MREETDTKIDVPPEGSDVTVVTVSGPKDNVDKAREMLEKTQKALVGAGSRARFCSVGFCFCTFVLYFFSSPMHSLDRPVGLLTFR